jgi:hypothetical protein
MLNIMRIIFFISFAYLLSACTNTTSVKFQETNKNISRIYLIPTGKLEFDSLYTYDGAGLLDILVIRALRSESIENELNTLRRAVSRKELDRINFDIIKQKLSLIHNTKFEELEVSLPESDFNEWFNPKKKIFSIIKKYEKDSLLIEFGYEEIYIQQKQRCSLGLFDLSRCNKMGGGIGIRVVDSNTGNIVGRGFYRNNLYDNMDGAKFPSNYTVNMSDKEKTKFYSDTVVKFMRQNIKKALDKAL